MAGHSQFALLIADTFTLTCTHAFTHPNTEGKRASEQENGERHPPQPISRSSPAIRQQREARMSIATCPQVVDTCSKSSILLDSMLFHPVAVKKLKILALDLERCKRAATPYMLSVSEPLPNCDKTSQVTDVEDWFFARDRSSTCCACSWVCTKSTINPYSPTLPQTALPTEACAFATTFGEHEKVERQVWQTDTWQVAVTGSYMELF